MDHGMCLHAKKNETSQQYDLCKEEAECLR